MRMDAQTTKKLLRVRLALLRHDSKLSLSPLAEGNCLYREACSRPLLSVIGKTGLHEAVTSESGCSNTHLYSPDLGFAPDTETLGDRAFVTVYGKDV